MDGRSWSSSVAGRAGPDRTGPGRGSRSTAVHPTRSSRRLGLRPPDIAVTCRNALVTLYTSDSRTFAWEIDRLVDWTRPPRGSDQFVGDLLVYIRTYLARRGKQHLNHVRVMARLHQFYFRPVRKLFKTISLIHQIRPSINFDMNVW